jgi:hypothetical protein
MSISMKINPAISLAVAAVSLSLLCTPVVHAQIASSADTSTPAGSANIAAAEREAAQMVPALAELDGSVSADMESGRRFEATLGNAVRLKDGTELPDGTELIGFVAYHTVQADGGSSLALRFTTAKLSDGDLIPIKATITGLFPPEVLPGSVDYATENAEMWDGTAIAIDQQGDMAGGDFHSRIASDNSGLFISRSNDVRLLSGSELALAIAPASQSGQNAGF